ncbi:MAG: PcfJ domain-containing protein [Pirellulales bacterium]
MSHSRYSKSNTSARQPKRCRYEIDRALHEALASVERDRSAGAALLELIHHVRSSSSLVRPDATSARPAWADAALCVRGLGALARMHGTWRQRPDSWIPCDGSRLAEFGSLARHLFGGCNVPSCLVWSWFAEPSARTLRHQKWFRHLARGYSLLGLDLPLPFTRPMAQHFRQAPGCFSVEQALRWAQVRGLGGGSALAGAIAASRLGESFDHPDYWTRVIRFLISRPQLAPEAVSPLVEYLNQHTDELFATRRNGRKAGTLLLDRALRWWTAPRCASKRPELSWNETGIGGFELVEPVGGSWHSRRWTIRELTNSNEIEAEGKGLRHCVGTYAEDCFKRRSSIWSLTCSDHRSRFRRLLTIEVDPQTRVIVQARGACDSRPKPDARKVMLQWAASRRLRVEKWV